MRDASLDQLGRHAVGEVVEVMGHSALAQRLMALGFLPGRNVRIVQVAPFGDPITIELDGWRVSLRRAGAALVRVRPVSGEQAALVAGR